MKSKDIFMVILLCTVVLGASLLVVHFADNKQSCTRPYINIGGQCCQDLNGNAICDSHELKAFEEIDRQKKEAELIQLKTELTRLKSDVNYYKSNYEAERDRDDDDEFTIRVRVLDDEDDEEIEDAYVRMVNEDDEDDYYETEYTDDDGEAKFKDVEDDCYEVKVRVDDYITKVKDYCFDESETIRIYLDRE